MGNVWFTADTHWHHINIIKHCQRPFWDVEEMNEVMIDRINECVKKNDTLYHLGDWSWRDLRLVRPLRNRLVCEKVHLILGNHDKRIRNNANKLMAGFLGERFVSISDIKEINIGDDCITLCHYSMRRWNKKHYGAYHLFGHSHGTLERYDKSMDVGVDTHNFYPWAWEEVKDILDG